MTGDRTVGRVDRGEWAVAAALLVAGAGLAVGSQVLVVAATLPLWYVAAAVFGTRRSAVVRVSREINVDGEQRSDKQESVVSVDPGETATVRTTVQNADSEPIVDLRIVDGVPASLSVVSGTPRACVSLEPLETTTVEYEMQLERGEYTFDDATVRTRGPSGSVTETWTPDVDGQDTVRCTPTVETVPLGDATNDYAGDVPTDEGGSGVEFYSVRDYEPSDPVNSIDWRRYAASRELATVEYRAERSTRVVCIVDARPSQFRAATVEAVPAVDHSADAAERTLETLIDAGHPTGVIGISERWTETVEPGTGAVTRERATRLLETARKQNYDSWFYTLSSGGLGERVATELPGEAQVYLFSSFVDDAPLELVEQLRTRGFAVRIVSPDVTGGDDLATRLEALDRENRLAHARATGARVVDWEPERSLGLVLHEAIGEVSRR
ncbi:DUF58 domain-containing protein [Natronobacterium texcoconense]|uniref:Conserved repeat domain-containing protein n=1 Tax=Natronobacterium texcoconense TaxID=1095778 RepID=A0A1H0ZHX9_NATTX|nr:DUF58 domain-containing protein [Natronobacterium texcoconense]SDQ26751.1 conserved repeat domain-containing protein [Natronobacterium texcoconense]